MTLKVIGAGFGRTGTASMKAALEQLGYGKCHHMFEVMPDAKQVELWHRIAQGETPDWDAIYADFGACVDFPSAAYWRELSEHYPNAKIVLTTRAFDGWYDSANETIYAITLAMGGWMNLVPRFRKIKEMVYGAIWDRVFDGRFADRNATREVFEKHEADVKAAFNSDRLLIFHPKQGWEPLCEFLGKPVPETPFPNVNDREAFLKQVRMMRMMKRMPWILGGLIVAGAAAFLAFR